jgi:hypothetical protein
MAKPKTFDFMGMVNDLSGIIQKQGELLRPRVVWGHFWDGKTPKAREELERLTDEQLSRLVIVGNEMVSAAANLRVMREREAEKASKKAGTDGVG